MKKVFPLLFLCLFFCGCSAKIAENEATTTEKMVLLAAEKAKFGKNSGPIALEYRKLDVSEISKYLDMDEPSTLTYLKSNGVHGYYSLIVRNPPPGEEFILYQIDYKNTISPVKRFYATGNGTLVTPLDELHVDIQNNFLFFCRYLKGEPVDFVLCSRDGRYSASTRIIPNPADACDEEGRSLSVQINRPDLREYLVSCKGLEPFKTYMLVTLFENEKFVHAVEADENGEVYKTAGPTAPWVTGGDGSVELRGEGLSRMLSASFEWGLTN